MPSADQTSQHGRDGFLHRYHGLRARLPGHGGVREAAAADFARLGLPGPRDEAWHYTNLRGLADIAFAEPLVAVADRPALLDRVPAFAAPRIVYVDGRHRADLSDDADAARYRVGTVLGRLARPDRDAFAALNTMLAEDGARITIPAGIDAGTMLLISLATADIHGRPIAFHPRHHIELGESSRLNLIEVSLGEGTYLHNPLSEIVVAAGARLTHLRLQDEAAAAFHVSTTYVEIAAAGTYDSFLLNMGGQLSRNEVHARLGGVQASVQLNCAQLLRDHQHGDFTTTVAHDAVAGRSRQTVRNVLDGHARGVFQGRIDVAQVAQQTDGYQMNHALLLSAQAEIDSKPELRINADDVKCSHGATVGELDANQLFYLRSRGIAEEEARAMLIRGFLAESLADIGDDTHRALFDAAAESWWARP